MPILLKDSLLQALRAIRVIEVSAVAILTAVERVNDPDSEDMTIQRLLSILDMQSTRMDDAHESLLQALLQSLSPQEDAERESSSQPVPSSNLREKPSKPQAKKPAKERAKRVLSPEALQRISEAQKRRWAAVRAKVPASGGDTPPYEKAPAN